MPDPNLCKKCRKPATCYGQFEPEENPSYACDDCCSHNDWYGKCRRLPDTPKHTLELPPNAIRFLDAYGKIKDVPLDRVAACYDACANIPHPEHIQKLVEAVDHMDKLVRNGNSIADFGDAADRWEAIQTALSKLKGE